jgi:hypothetical protein
LQVYLAANIIPQGQIYMEERMRSPLLSFSKKKKLFLTPAGFLNKKNLNF